MNLYIAAENIPAGYYVEHRDPASQNVYPLDPIKAETAAGGPIKIIVGVAAENLREGFRVCAADGEVREDDA